MSTNAEPYVAPRLCVESLYRAHRSDIHRFLVRELGDAGDAEDATQTVFVNAHRSLVRGCVPVAPRAWLYAIARNVARSTWRDRCARPTADVDLELIPGDDSPDELRRDLVDALESLPERQREALVLHELGGLEYSEIASATNQSVAGIETAIFRARRACRSELAGDGALDHEAASRLLGRFVGGKLTRQERQALQKHVAACATCADDERALRAARPRRRGLVGWLLSLPEAIQRASALVGGHSPRGLATIAAAIAAAGGAATLPSLGGGPAPDAAEAPTAPATVSVPTTSTAAAAPAPSRRDADARTVPVGSRTAGKPSPTAAAPTGSRQERTSSPDGAEAPAAAASPKAVPPTASRAAAGEPRQRDGVQPAPRPLQTPIRTDVVGSTVGTAVATVEGTLDAAEDTVTTVVEQAPLVGAVVDSVADPGAAVPGELGPLPPVLPPVPEPGLSG